MHATGHGQWRPASLLTVLRVRQSFRPVGDRGDGDLPQRGPRPVCVSARPFVLRSSRGLVEESVGAPPLHNEGHVHQMIAKTLSLGIATTLAIGGELIAQERPHIALQLEVRDSVGLPLPDAAVEVFMFHEGGIVWEWTPATPESLGPGVHLLRFSHPGYRSSVLSVPLRKDRTVSLRVNLENEREPAASPATARELRARPVRAIGLSLDGKNPTDIIGGRRVYDRGELDALKEERFGNLMRRIRDDDFSVIPGTGSVRVVGHAGASQCAMSVVLNGDRRQVVGFNTLERHFRPDEVEAIEIFPRSTTVPQEYRVRVGGCGVVVLWLRDP